MSKYSPIVSSEEREKELNRLKRENDPISKIKIKKIESLDNKTTFEVYRIPLDYLIYNPHNKRFATRSKTLEKKIGQLDSTNPDHIKHIERFLWDYNKSRNEATVQSLIADTQLKPGIVSCDGMILSGNRRFMLLNHIRDNIEGRYKGVDLNQVEHFEAAILSKPLDNRAGILTLESSFQYGEDEKLEYASIEKYLAIHEQHEVGLSLSEIYRNFQGIAKNEKQIQDWLDVFKLMEEYIEYIGHKGIYTDLYHDNDSREEHFITLHGWLRNLRNRRSKTTSEMWDYGNRDITDFKLFCFDFIRRYVPVHTVFRDLFKYFQNKDLWSQIYPRYKESVDKANDKLETFDEFRGQRPQASEEEVAEARNATFSDLVKGDFDAIIRTAKSTQADGDLRDKPLEILGRIKSLINQLDDGIQELIKSSPEYPSSPQYSEIVEEINDVRKIIAALKQRLD